MTNTIDIRTIKWCSWPISEQWDAGHWQEAEALTHLHEASELLPLAYVGESITVEWPKWARLETGQYAFRSRSLFARVVVATFDYDSRDMRCVRLEVSID